MNLPNEDIPVRVAKHEDMEANTKYDLDCCVRNDSDKSEIELSEIYGMILKRMIMMMMTMGRSQLFMIRECGLVTVHLITMISS